MSKATFSNAETGSKAADPYKATNKDETSLKEKIEDLVHFVEASKFGMMTTLAADSGLLVSRCMALAGKVRVRVQLLISGAHDYQETGGVDLIFHTNTESGKTDDLATEPKINISFINSSGEWASLSGKAEIITDRDVVHKYYSRQLKAWVGDLGDGKHDGGPNGTRASRPWGRC